MNENLVIYYSHGLNIYYKGTCLIVNYTKYISAICLSYTIK